MKLRPESAKPANATLKRISSWRVKGFVLLFSLILALAASEIILRTFFSRALYLFQDERSLLYQFDRTLGWFPVPNTRARIEALRVIFVQNNSLGFRAQEEIDHSRPGIIFLGDSFVWGFDVNADERFTENLQTKHPEWAIYNCGISGYGTDQEYLLLQKYYDVFQPKVVFLLFCTENDDEDNSTNARYGGYYKPYFIVKSNHLELRGVPVPKSERAWLAEHKLLARSYLVRLVVRTWYKFKGPRWLQNPNPTGLIIRDLQKFVQWKGGILVMGLTKRNPPLEEFLKFFHIPFVDLSTSLRFADVGNHWTPEGQTYVCEQIDQFLRDGKYMEQAQPVAAPP
jgi:hypothetical protein